MSTHKGRHKLPCRYFNTPKGCFRGDDCTFLHDPKVVMVDSEPHEHDGLYKWARGIGRNGEPLGTVRLANLFTTGLELVKKGGNNAQGVVTRLSKEGGLKCIDEVYMYAQSGSVQTLQNLLLPFFEIICEDQVRNSFVLEKDLETIYNFLYGPNGRRASAIYSYAVSEFPGFCREATPGQATSALNIMALSFTNVVELNSSAVLIGELKDACQEMLAFVKDLDKYQFLLYPAMAALDKTAKRYAIAADFPKGTSDPPKKYDGRSQPTFKLARDGPGSLSAEGRRHDNDFTDIRRIKILPTALELASSRPDYLPVLDLSQSHLDGIKALLDRQFRLLREDTVGQLRDAAKSIFDDQADRSKAARTLIYENASMVRMDFDMYRGLDILYAIDQPKEVRAMKAKERKDWWKHSKRLQRGALVCLIGLQTTPIFCSVNDTGLDKDETASFKIEEQEKLRENLYDHSDKAYMSLTLVETTQESVQAILDEIVAGHSRGLECLVEFPGVLIPSFKPTLEALQRMSKRADSVPFAPLIAPIHANAHQKIKVKLPRYARRPGFRYDLRCLTANKGEEMWYNPLSKDEDDSLQKALLAHTTLDAGQARSLQQALSQELALIQGPPGTGKTFLGVSIIEVLLANSTVAHLGPIICVCYTNHALDQLLEHLLEKGVEKIIRVGSRSKSEALGKLTLAQVGREIDRTRTENGQYYRYKKDVDRCADELKDLFAEFEKAGSLASLKDFLSTREPHHYSALFQEEVDEEGFRTKTYGSGNPVRDWLGNRGRHKSHLDQSIVRPIDELRHAPLTSMSRQERVNLYHHWTNRIRQQFVSRIMAELGDYLEAKKCLDAIRKETDLRCLKQAQIIGVTTSGLARVVDLLERVESKVLVCEEAGEVLEAHMLSTFLATIEHAIFIGDQQQLRPQVQNYDLTMESPRGKQYSFDLSLFERLIDSTVSGGSELPYSTLELQRRMHPSISELLRMTSYPDLLDDPSVDIYPEVVGMRRRLFWLNHDHLEAAASKDIMMATSHSNDWEVEIIAAMVTHLVSQGVYTSQDIAVLTPYLGQLRKIRSRLASSFVINVNELDQAELDKSGEALDGGNLQARNVQLLQGIRLATIDNFQGEEAKVVIISLVRCNQKKTCGFLRTPNRVNVLLSRAKHGMYLIGNKASYESVGMWDQVIQHLQQDGNLGTELELACPRHPDVPLMAKTPDDFSILSPEGGCNLKCTNRLKCGHACTQKCHSEMLHNSVKCLEPCQRTLKGCDDHPCPRVCGDYCPPRCSAPILNVELPCGHITTLPCWQSKRPHEAKCLEKVSHISSGCKHEITVECHQLQNTSNIDCSAVCEQALQCGHNCKRICHDCRKVDTATQKPVIDHGACVQVCNRPFKLCQHSCQEPCHNGTPCSLCTAPCEVRCAHSACSKKCCEPCAPCAAERCASQCPHQRCELPCAVPCNWKPCPKRCELELGCGHQCPGVCGESCPPIKYCQECASDEILSTEVDFIMGERYGEVDLNIDPCIFLLCGHFFTRSSMDGTVGMSDHYLMGEDGSIESIIQSSEPFDAKDLKTCPQCRGTLRNICRYGRIVKRALLDESTKRFISWAQNQNAELASEAARMEAELSTLKLQKPYERQLQLRGNRTDQITAVKAVAPFQLKEALRLHANIEGFLERVRAEEQPYRQVWSMVENIRRRKGKLAADMAGELTKIEMRFQTYAMSLLLKHDLALLSAAVKAKEEGLKSSVIVEEKISEDFVVDLEVNRLDCLQLVHEARESKYLRQETEGHLLFAQYCCLEKSVARISEGSRMRVKVRNPDGSVTIGPRTPAVEDLVELATMHLEEAAGLCQELPGTTKGLMEEVEETRKMLRSDTTFFEPVTSEERLQVIKAMYREFNSAYGAWYRCVNGHPFAVGECGYPMQLARCPECGSPAGGRNHVRAEGVQAAHELNDLMGRARLD